MVYIWGMHLLQSVADCAHFLLLWPSFCRGSAQAYNLQQHCLESCAFLFLVPWGEVLLTQCSGVHVVLGIEPQLLQAEPVPQPFELPS